MAAHSPFPIDAYPLWAAESHNQRTRCGIHVAMRRTRIHRHPLSRGQWDAARRFSRERDVLIAEG